MRENKGRKDLAADAPVSVVILSAACCVRGMAALDEQARRIVDRALSETGVNARVTVMAATTAMFGGLPRNIMADLIARSQNGGQLPVPAILINGKPFSYGMPELESLKSELRFQFHQQFQQEKQHERRPSQNTHA